MVLDGIRKEAFNWWEKNEKAFLSEARRYGLSDDLAKDMLQEVAILVCRKLPDTVDNEGKFIRWVKTTLKNRIIDWIRKERYVFETIDENTLKSSILDQEESLLLKLMLENIDKLPETQRKVLLNHIIGKSTKATAYELGINESTVRSNLRHARVRLGELIG